jgi:hypothetical protein
MVDQSSGPGGRLIGAAFRERFVAIAEMVGDMDRAARLDRARHVGKAAEAEGHLERVVVFPLKVLLNTNAVSLDQIRP